MKVNKGRGLPPPLLLLLLLLLLVLLLVLRYYCNHFPLEVKQTVTVRRRVGTLP